MTTVNNKKCYPSEKYLNELITNIEFAARAPVEVVRAIAAELQKHRKAYANTAASKDGLKWFTEFGHLNRGDMLTSEQHRCHN
ncbi:hypothetical protein G7M10_06590, partial [Escherichia coli]|nr:hypothetical protein [Escherichia coli]